MTTRIIKVSLMVGITTLIPLIGVPVLLLHPKIVVLVTAGLTMLLTQPEFKQNEAKRNCSTDRWSVAAILLAGVVTQVLCVIEWGYGQINHTGSPVVTLVGLALIVGGLAFRIWSIRTLGKFFTATVQIVDGHRVIKHGPYAIVRHPSYLGAWATFIGFGLFLNVPFGTVFGAVSIGMAYILRISVEEKTLLAAFGPEYADYRTKVKAIIPGIL